jgi:hypothetical protein
MNGLVDNAIVGLAAEAARGRAFIPVIIHESNSSSIQLVQWLDDFGGLTVFNRGSRRESKER